MPRLSVWIIRTALLYLGLGFTWGALMLFQKGVSLGAGLLRMMPMHIEFVLIGWTLQLAMGVAFWILPRFARGPSRGDETLVWAAYVLLNVGVLSAGIGQWLAQRRPRFLSWDAWRSSRRSRFSCFTPGRASSLWVPE